MSMNVAAPESGAAAKQTHPKEKSVRNRTEDWETRIARERENDGRPGYWTRAEMLKMDSAALAKMAACHPEKTPQTLKEALVRYYIESTRPSFVADSPERLIYHIFQVLPQIVAEESPELVTELPGELSRAKQIREAVCKRHRISEREIRSETRTKRYCAARHEAMYLIALDTMLSWTRISRMLGRDDHSTVIRGVASHARKHGLPLPREATR